MDELLVQDHGHHHGQTEKWILRKYLYMYTFLTFFDQTSQFMVFCLFCLI